MSAEAGIVTLLLLLYAAPPVVAQASRCHYMVAAIPREPRPDNLPDIEWSGVWSNRPIVPGPERDEVCMDEYFVGAGTLPTQIIHLQEEVEDDIPIARLNYNGPATPVIEVPFFAGSFNQLEPRLRHENGEWLLVITQRQDYEIPSMRTYMFQIRVPGESLAPVVSLQIANIDDNDPVIRPIESCVVPELGVAPRLTNCVYEVRDEDGELSMRMMTFQISSDRNDNEIFYTEPNFIVGTWEVMTMTLGLETTLNFETSPLHIFQVTAFDSVDNNNTLNVMVQVENVEHRPPRWIDIFAVQQFDEKTSQNFTVRAIDGDTGIDRPINYRLEKNESYDFFRIETIDGGRNGAIFYVDPIDRDYLEQDLFQLSIIAYKIGTNETFATPAPIAIIINDVNDQRPEPLEKEYFVTLLEETPLTIDFETEFGFHDRDLGRNAQYEVHLESDYPEGAHLAFYIAPTVGYQRQTFIMGTVVHSMLDYENIPFQHIKLRVIATDLDNPTFTGVIEVNIDLENWNDEVPIFENNSLTVDFKETEGKGFYVETMLAKDRDIGDIVVHSLMGNAGEYLWINDSTGEIWVSEDDAFDYHRQNVLFVQVRADDTLMAPYHTVTSQLIIRLIDVNNTPPTLRLPRGTHAVEENKKEGYEITSEITATDPDTTAHLRFDINWDTSFATKQGRDTPAIEFHGCVDIETIFTDPTTHGTATGRIVVKEIRPGVTIDFEEFELLFITVRVWDDNTELDSEYDESTFTITIIDMNDNKPIFAADTLEQNFRVREMSDSDIVIGSVLATDIDGPLYNQVRYTLFPRNETPENLVKIDFDTGQISVDKSGAIDADIPPRWNLYYTIEASDRCYAEDIEECPPDPTSNYVKGDITIQILDTNNQTPQSTKSDEMQEVRIFENATSGDIVLQLDAIDLDRDEIYNTVHFRINFEVNMNLAAFFAVDQETGLITVEYTTNAVLDRDGDQPTHTIFLTLIDNIHQLGGGNSNQNTTTVTVILLDVNDNAPELPSDLSWSISENENVEYRLDPEIEAPDRDEKGTDNSAVGYAILDLSVTNRDISVPHLFRMNQMANVSGELEVAMPLRGYWGTYSIHILAFDHGVPQQMSNETYELEIRPYNFHAPEFVFPVSGSFIRLARERAAVNVILAYVNGDSLDRVSATDEDGLHAGVVTFEVVGNGEASDYFTVENDGVNQGFLTLKEMFTDTDVHQTRSFEVIIRATDGGTEPGSLSTDTTLNLIFVPTVGDPIFETNTDNVSFFEQEAGLEEMIQLPIATDPKNTNCTDDCLPIYYRIFAGIDDGYFGLEPNENVLYLQKQLDREQAASHVITVAASNTLTPGIPLPGSTLTVNIAVREANPRPIFENDLYLAGLSITDSIGRVILTVHARHTEGASVTYTIDLDSMVVDPSMEAVRDSSFLLNPNTGVMTLNMQPHANMHGMFEFNVVATDPAGQMDTAIVRIYMISVMNRVTFTFENTVSQIEAHRTFIANTFTVGFRMQCVIDEVLPASDNNGVALSDHTDARAHFLDDNQPVSAEVIEALRSDTSITRQIQNTLRLELIVLHDMATVNSPTNDVTRIYIFALAGLAGVLALLCVVLLIVFVVRTRDLNDRLEALTVKRYGSVDSGRIRAGMLALPNTNLHRDEGSNPVWNEAINAPDFDAISEMSGDSDLIGIEDMPQFRTEQYPAEDDMSPSVLGHNQIASHSNNFGLNTAPINSDFSNKQFGKI